MTPLEKQLADALERLGTGLNFSPDSQGWKDGCWCGKDSSARYHNTSCEKANQALKEFYRQQDIEKNRITY